MSLMLVSAGAVVGSVLQTPPVAWGQTASQPTFQSGGQLAVPLLKEMVATLQKMDTRLARLEAIANQLQKPADRQRALNKPD